MRILDNHKELQAVRHLPFCYLCGCKFTASDKRSRDHVPPKAIFATEDRSSPLVLPAHFECNQRESVGDEVLAQLVAVLHGKHAAPDRQRLKFGVVQLNNSGRVSACVHGHNLKPLVWRCVKGFHAALYGIPLAVHGMANVHLPFPEGRIVPGHVTWDRIPEQHAVITNELKKSRLAGAFDRICCYAGKCIYECIWLRADGGEWLCMFGLRLYDWENLGDTATFPSRGCVGVFCLGNGRPENGTVGTSLVFSPPGGNPLDPFN